MKNTSELNTLTFQGVTCSRVASDYPLEVSLYLRHRLVELIDQRRLAQKDIAAAIGVTKGRISQLYNKGGGFGRPMVKGMCRLLNLDEREVERVAHEWVEAHPEAMETTPTPGERIERPDRYPNRATAIQAARILRYPEEAIAQVAGIVLKSEIDPDPDWWLDEIRSVMRRMHWETVAPREVAKERAASDAAVDELEELVRPKPTTGLKKK